MGPKLKNQQKLNKKNQAKEERANRYINQRKKDSYLADDNNYEQFTKQLARLGLELRDITGDGNCLFRALSDQLEGTEGNHLLYRRQVCEYMRKNRVDFEPFVVGLYEEIENKKKGGRGGNNEAKNASGVDAFDKYVNNLEQSGTYGGNDALVAFARLHQLEIHLHQLDQPIWKVNGAFQDMKNVKQIHLSYHNGEHYSSIRRVGDTNNNPANIHINTVPGNPNVNSSNNNNNNKKSNKCYNSNSYENYEYDEYVDEIDEVYNVDNGFGLESKLNLNEKSNDNYNNKNELIIASGGGLTVTNPNLNDNSSTIDEVSLDNIMNITNCYDLTLIKDLYNENNRNLELTITRLISILASTNNETNANKEQDDENGVSENENDNILNSNNKESGNRNRPKKMNAREKKMIKKQKQMERQRNKVIEEREKEKSKVAPRVNDNNCCDSVSGVHEKNCCNNNHNNNSSDKANDDNEVIQINLNNIQATSI